MNSWSSGQPKNDAKTLFSTLHPLSMVIFATATVVAFILLCNSRFNFHCYTQCEAMPTQKSARKWRCDLSQLLARKITKGIHSCKPASLNCPIQSQNLQLDNAGGSTHPCPPLDCLKRWQSDHICYLCWFNQLATKIEKWNEKPRLACVNGPHPLSKIPVDVLPWTCQSEGNWLGIV